MKILTKLALISITSFVMANETNYNPNIDLKAGQKYLKEHNINLAIAAFERVLMYQPNNNKAKLYLAKTYIQIGKIDLAKKYLKEIQNPSKDTQKEIASIYAKYPDKTIKFDLSLLVGMSFDSNINNDTDADRWDIYENGDTKTIYNFDNEKESAFSIYELINIDPIYQKQLTLHNSLTLYNKNVINKSENDIQVVDYKPYLYQSIKDIKFNHGLEYKYTRYGNDDYTNYFGIYETIKFDFFKTHTNKTNISFGLNHYLSNTIDNSDYYLFNIDTKITKHFYNANLSLNCGFETTKKTTESKNITEYNSFNIGLGGNIALSSYLVALNSNLTFKNYLDENSYFQKKEKDKKIDTTFSIYKKGKYFTYQTKLQFINNISNITPYEYNKWLLSLNIIKTFKGL